VLHCLQNSQLMQEQLHSKCRVTQQQTFATAAAAELVTAAAAAAGLSRFVLRQRLLLLGCHGCSNAIANSFPCFTLLLYTDAAIANHQAVSALARLQRCSSAAAGAQVHGTACRARHAALACKTR
jgi:hypothetical protein